MTDLMELLNKVDHNEVAELMANYLTDPNVQTYDMFENIATDYTKGNEDFRKGMDRMFEILTWHKLEVFVNAVENYCTKGEEE